jgi:hypothetical protein
MILLLRLLGTIGQLGLRARNMAKQTLGGHLQLGMVIAIRGVAYNVAKQLAEDLDNLGVGLVRNILDREYWGLANLEEDVVKLRVRKELRRRGGHWQG